MQTTYYAIQKKDGQLYSGGGLWGPHLYNTPAHAQRCCIVGDKVVEVKIVEVREL